MKKKIPSPAIFYFILPALLLLFQGCKRENDPPEPEIFLFDQAMYDYCYFKAGTWWVYRDSATGMLDTVNVIKSSRGMDTARHDDGTIWRISDWFDTKLTSSHSDFIQNRWGHSSWKNLAFRDRTKPGDFVGEATFFFLPADIGAVRSGGGAGIVILTEKADTLTIHGKRYEHVIVLENSQSLPDWGSETITKFAINTGIIQFEIKDSAQVWQLIDYNIIQ